MRSLLDAVSASAWRVVGLFFLTTLASTWFIQLVLLTLLFPHWSDGNGLLRGWDVGGFHSVAAAQTLLIAEQGWQAWELRPNGWGVSGLLSAWYAMTIPAPWAFAPVQSLLYAVGMGVVFVLMHAVCGQRRHALIAVLPFLVFPSAATLYAQPHRDLFVFCAVMLALLGWWQLLRVQTQHALWRMLVLCLGGMLLIAAGFTLGFAVRSLFADLLQLIAVIMLVISVMVATAHALRGFPDRWYGPLISVFASLAVAVVMLLGHQSSGYSDWATVATDSASNDEQRAADEPGTSDGMPSDTMLTDADPVVVSSVWEPSEWLPGRIDASFRRLAGARNHLLTDYGDSRSLVDGDVVFSSTVDVLAYLPRAMQIGVLSPFPAQWAPHPEAPPFRNIQRVLNGAEILVWYALFPFLGVALWVWRARPAVWVIVLPASAWIAVYAITVPMVGALVRYRYVALILLFSLAVAAFLRAVERSWSETRKRET